MKSSMKKLRTVTVVLVSVLGFLVNDGLSAESVCPESLLHGVDREYNGKWDFNSELVANEYALYAAASSDAYEDLGKKRFLYNDIRSWSERPDGRGYCWWDGLSYDVYYRQSEEFLDVMVAFRGTDPDAGILIDVPAGNIPFLARIPYFGQYDVALRHFRRIRNQAEQDSHGRTVRYVLTGHSLGGGIAQYVASKFPCIDVVVFNSSPFSFVSKTPDEMRRKVIKLWEDKDPIGKCSRRVERTRNTTYEIEYKTNVISDNSKGLLSQYGIELSQHGIEKVAAGLARMASDCKFHTPDCEIEKDQKEQNNGYDLYCKKYRPRITELLGKTQEDEACGP